PKRESSSSFSVIPTTANLLRCSTRLISFSNGIKGSFAVSGFTRSSHSRCGYFFSNFAAPSSCFDKRRNLPGLSKETAIVGHLEDQFVRTRSCSRWFQGLGLCSLP